MKSAVTGIQLAICLLVFFVSDVTPGKTQREFIQEKLKPFYDAFAILDKDGNGRVSKAEIKNAMDALDVDIDKHELEDMLDHADEDDNGTMDVGEFLQMLAHFTEAAEADDEELREAFSVFDKDADGVISVGELKYVMARLGEEIDDDVAKTMLAEADIDSDGSINYEEFKTMMTALLLQ